MTGVLVQRVVFGAHTENTVVPVAIGVETVSGTFVPAHPVGMGKHPQATLYALAECAAEVMLGELL